MHKTTVTEVLQIQTPFGKAIVLRRIPTHIATVQEVCVAQDMRA